MPPRLCRRDDPIAAIVNAAAEKYRGVIPPDCFHEPYMSPDALAQEIARGVEFWGCEVAGVLAGVMGLQRVKGQSLIRHAYVLPAFQGQGIGSQLLSFLIAKETGSILVGTWADADWAIKFYRKHGFVLVEREDAVRLLQTYWTVSPRQIETSVVLRRDP
jgi:GNAT superfamily N-acetyltransferase